MHTPVEHSVSLHPPEHSKIMINNMYNEFDKNEDANSDGVAMMMLILMLTII